MAGQAEDLEQLVGHSSVDEHPPPWKRKERMLRLGGVGDGMEQLKKQLQEH